MATRMEYFIICIQKIIKSGTTGGNINLYPMSINIAVFGRVQVEISYNIDLPHLQPRESTESWNIKSILILISLNKLLSYFETPRPY